MKTTEEETRVEPVGCGARQDLPQSGHEVLPSLEDKMAYCKGCRDDFYNHDGHAMNGQHCWSLPTAHVVRRYRIGWWTPMDRASNFEEVTTLDCHHAPGVFAFCKELPEHLRADIDKVRR